MTRRRLLVLGVTLDFDQLDLTAFRGDVGEVAIQDG